MPRLLTVVPDGSAISYSFGMVGKVSEKAVQTGWHRDGVFRQLSVYMSVVAMEATSHGPAGDRTSMAIAEPLNIATMIGPLEISQPDRSPLKLLVLSNIDCMLETCETSQPARSPLKLLALSNIDCMLETCETSQLERSPLKLLAPRNMDCMLET